MQTDQTRSLPGTPDPAWRIGIVHSSFYRAEMDALVAGANTFLVQNGIPAENIRLMEAAGSFEVPLLGSALAEAGAVDALIGLGIIVEGETNHARLLADTSAGAMMEVQLMHGIPFAFEILHVHTLAQAQERTKAGSNKGEEAAYAVLHSLLQLKRIQEGSY
jgi:6,7-dimethyl-8-ribityllumazine synthase